MSIGSASELSAQLVVEIFVSDIEESLAFYQAIGFEVERSLENFAALRWDKSYLFLGQRAGQVKPPKPVANIRIVINDIESTWKKVQASDLAIETPLTEQSYGLKDFTLIDPDGFGVRFAEVL